MATVIDEFVLELGLDPSKFKEGRKALEDEQSKALAVTERFAKQVEAQGAKISEVFGFVKRGVVGVIGAFVGAEAASFIDKIASMDAHTSRLASSIGSTTRELSIWQNMIRHVGGDAGQANATFAGINDAFVGFAMGTAMPSPAFAQIMARSGIDFRRDSPDDALKKITEFVGSQPERSRRGWLSAVPGMNEGMMFLILEGAKNMARFREEIERTGVASDHSAAQAKELQDKTAELGTALDNLSRGAFPVLTWLANQLSNFIKDFTGEEGMKGGFRKFLGPEVAQGTIGGKIFDWIVGPPDGGSSSSVPIKPGAGASSDQTRAAMAALTGVSGISAITSLNDAFHQGLGGSHPAGLAMDLTISNPSKSAEMVAAIKKALAAKGITATVLDEYKKPSSHATAPHIHIGAIHVTSNKADPAAVADEVPAAIQRHSMLAGINSGLA